MNQKTTLERESTSDSVADIIRRRIISGDYKPKKRLVTDEIAQELGVSQTPVREALRTLQAEFLLQIHPYRGAIINGVLIDELKEVYELRRYIEVYAAQKAVTKYSSDHLLRLEDLLKRMNESNHTYPSGEYWQLHREFHRALLGPASETGWLQKYIELLWQSTERYRALYAAGLRSFDEVHAGHCMLFKAASEHDTERFTELIDAHITAVEKTVIVGYKLSISKEEETNMITKEA